MSELTEMSIITPYKNFTYSFISFLLCEFVLLPKMYCPFCDTFFRLVSLTY